MLKPVSSRKQAEHTIPRVGNRMDVKPWVYSSFSLEYEYRNYVENTL
jgi:hypothetical protein